MRVPIADDEAAKEALEHSTLKELHAQNLERMVEERTKEVGESEARYRYFVEQTAEGFYRIESEEPISIRLPEDEQIRMMYEHMYVAECNDIFAWMYGLPSAEAMIGTRFVELHGSPDIPENIEVLRSFIRSGYRVIDVETKETDQEGNPIWFLNNAVGIVADEFLLSVWGTQRDITERKRAEEEIKRRSEELEALREISLAITAQLELNELLQNIVEQGCRLLDVGAGGVYLVDETRGDLELVVSHGYTRDYTGIRLAPGEGLSGKVLQSGEPLAVDDYQHWEGRSPDWEAEPITGCVGVPLKRGERVIGVLVFAEITRARSFDQHDIWLVTLFANQAVIAIENARLYHEAQRRAERLAVVNRIARAASATLHLDDLVETVYQEIASVFEADAFFIALYDGEADELDFRLQVDEGVREPPERRPLGPGLTTHVVTSRKPLLIRDFEKEKDRLPPAKLWGTMKAPPSWLGVPMRIGDRVVGVISVQAYRPHAYGEEEQLLLSTIADQVAVAVENARLYDETRRRLAREERLNELAHTLGGEMELVTLIPRLLPLVAELTGADASTVAIFDPDRNVITYPYSYNLPDTLAGVEVPAGSGLAGYTMRVRQPVLLDDYREHPAALRPWVEAGVRSLLAVPLVVGDEVVGAMGLFSLGEVRPFGPEAVAAAQAAGRLAAVAIQRARLFEAEQHRRQEAETLREAALALTTTLDRNQVIEHILAQLQQVVPYDTASVQLLRGDRLEIVGGRGFPNLDDLLGISFPIDGDNPNREVVRTRTPFIVEDAPAVYEEFRREPHAQADIRSWLGVPMLVGERLVGMITLDKHEPGFYTPEHARLAEAFAAQAAIAIENARLYEEARGHADKLAALYETSQHITSTLELDALLQLIAERSVQLTGADKSLILLVDTEMGKLIKAAGFGFTPGQIESFTYQEVQDGISGWVLRERTPTISEDILTDPRNTGLALEMAKKEPERSKSIAVAPLTITGEVIGTLTVVNNVGRPVFSQSDLDLVVMLANQAAIAIENSRLFQATQRQADELARLHKAAVAISSSLELSEVLRTLAKQVGRALDTSSAYICDWDEETDQSTVLAEWINPEATASEPDLGARYDLRRYPTTLQALQERQPLAVQATDPDLDPADRESAERYGWKSYLIIPLVIQDRAIGYVELWETRWKREFTEADVRLCQTLAADAAGAIERARLFQAEREQRELAEALAEAAAAISSTLNLDQVLDRILEQVERVVAGDAFNIMLVEDDNVRVVRWRGYEHLGVEDRISRFVIPIAEYPNLVKMVRTGEPVVIPDTASDPEWVLVEGWEWLRSYVAAPIQVGGLAVGFLCVDGTRPGQFGPADARRLQAFADHAATAIENAQLYREVLNHAEWLEERVQERTAQLQAQYARLDAILRSTTDGIVVTDEQGEIIQANPVAQTWLTQALSPEDAARLREAVRDLARRAEERPEMLLELKGLDLQLNAAPISEAGMEGAAAVVAVHDVSPLKALDRLKSRFVSNVSHELRTPITTIRLYLELLRRTPPEKWGKYLDALEREAEQQARLVEDILQISRIDAGRLEMEPRPTPLNELTEIAVVNHQVLARNQGLTLEHRPVEPGPVASVDPEQMMQVLNNLVRNAIQYTPEGGKVVVSTGKEEVEGRVWATATVADTGIGIPEEELPHIFERFFRGEEPRRMQVPGTGLGLAIVKEVLELHGGRVTVESQVGVGTTFTIWLPLA